MAQHRPTSRNPWAWVSTVYLAEGLPYVVVMSVAVILYKGLGISNTDIAAWTSLLYLPWVLKPLWSPVVDILKTRRAWIWFIQIVLGAGFAGIALSLHTSRPFRYSLAIFWLVAFSSATHDIAIDGFYMLATTASEQAFFVGIRSTFYRIANIVGQGLLVILAGAILDQTGLRNLDLRVSAAPDAPMSQFPQAGQFSGTPLAGELRIVAEPGTVVINPKPRPRAEIAAVIGLARSNNVDSGFYASESASQKSAAAPEWAITRWLRSKFGRKTEASEEAGNSGMISFHLSKPPGREVVVTLGSRVGLGFGANEDKLFSVAEGSRFVFTDTNWNQPALAVIQLDPKLRTAAEGVIEVRSGNLPLAWAATFAVLAGVFILFSIYHAFFLPYPARDLPGEVQSIPLFVNAFLRTFADYFRKDKIIYQLMFLLFYRFAEAQLVKMVAPFLLDARDKGGLGLTTGQVGFVYGTVGIASLTFGGLLGGFVAARNGLKFWLWWMVLAIHLPDLVFVLLSYAQPNNLLLINLGVALEQFGYGFGFTAYMLYMIYIARGRHATAHYAICTGFMALGMMISGSWSGWLQDVIGYRHFFVWVLLATIPGFLVVRFIPLDADFGRKSGSEAAAS